MTQPKTIADARRRLAGHADAAYKAQLERLVPGVRAIGVRVPVLRALARELGAPLDLDAACGFLDAACDDGGRELILLGTMLVARHRRQIPTLSWSRVAGWLAAIDNWETCDLLAMSVAAPVVA